MEKKAANYVSKSARSFSQQRHGNIDVIFKDPLHNEIDLSSVFNRVNALLPDHMLTNIDLVYIGDFDFMKQRKINASYVDGAIYMSNDQDNERDALDDLVHEFAHAVEEKYGFSIYEDGNIEKEFTSKRLKLKKILRIHDYNVDLHDFTKIEFDEELDQFLLNEVGYEKLSNLTIGMFLDPYSISSLREYFATGFEEYYLGDRPYLSDVCPYIYKKISYLHEENA